MDSFKIKKLMRELLIVSVGSFFGGGLRYAVSKALQAWCASPFPFGTFIVNVLGCLIIGFLSAIPLGGWLSPQTKLFLTTGFCGGFTTFSTFMNESYGLAKDGDTLVFTLYIVLSLAVGMLAVVAGHWIGKVVV